MNKEKSVGLIKWFHDTVKNANYGFIQHHKLGDLFFHEKGVQKNQDLNSFNEKEIVVFTIQESRKDKNKLEAIEVKHIKTENDTLFLFEQLLTILPEKGKFPDYPTLENSLNSRLSELLIKGVNDEKNILLDKYKSFIKEQENYLSRQDIGFIVSILNVCSKYFSESYKDVSDVIVSALDSEKAYQLWLGKYFDKCQIEYISKIILNINHQEKSLIFNRCTSEDKTNIFFKVLYDIESIDSDLKLDTIKSFLKLSKEFANEIYDKIIESTFKICPPYYRLNLWLENFHEILDFHSYKYFTISLSSNDQKKFVKKVLKYVHEGKISIQIEDLTSLNLIDYETSKVVNGIQKGNLDYSTSIILNVVAELNNNVSIESKKEATSAQFRIYDLIIKQIEKPDDILEIKGFFDECEGRCNISINVQKDENGEVVSEEIIYKRNEHNKPKLHAICDGRKAVNKKSDSEVKEHGVDFWWCANQKCFKPSRRIHSSDEWEKYSLIDFLEILKVKYEEKGLEVYLSIINKANRFLQHLKCRKCNHILRPIKKSNYAFYGVNDFHCVNEVCEEKNKRIYITHCLNGTCEQVIDSRDSVKCRPNDVDSDKCGWYVCNFCNSCCSNEAIERRIYILEKTGQVYQCHQKGHRDLGVISCNKCGFYMNSIEQNEAEYQKVLKWFMDNKDNKDYIDKYGQNKKGKWWFRFKKYKLSHDEYYNKLSNLIKLGFGIPSFEEYDKSIQLIAESDNVVSNNSDVLICSNKDCGNLIDMKSNLEKARAIKYFHKVRFNAETSDE